MTKPQPDIFSQLDFNPVFKDPNIRRAIEKACEQLAVHAVAEVYKIMRTDPSGDVRLKAATWIRDTGIGKPVQAIAAQVHQKHEFVIRTPSPIASAADWERMVEAERPAHDALHLPPPLELKADDPVPELPPIPGNPDPGPDPMAGAPNPVRKQGHSTQPDVLDPSWRPPEWETAAAPEAEAPVTKGSAADFVKNEAPDRFNVRLAELQNENKRPGETTVHAFKPRKGASNETRRDK